MPGYKAGSEDKVHMKPFFHIIDCQIRCQWCPRNIQFLYFLEGIFSFCISCNKTIDHNSRYFIIKLRMLCTWHEYYFRQNTHTWCSENEEASRPQIIGISRSACSFLLGRVLSACATDCRVIFRLD